MMSMIKIESYLIVDKLRDIDDAVDKLSSKTFLVKMERVFHKMMMMLINHYLQQTKLF